MSLDDSKWVKEYEEDFQEFFIITGTVYAGSVQNDFDEDGNASYNELTVKNSKFYKNKTNAGGRN